MEGGREGREGEEERGRERKEGGRERERKEGGRERREGEEGGSGREEGRQGWNDGGKEGGRGRERGHWVSAVQGPLTTSPPSPSMSLQHEMCLHGDA